jgi:hypothetical protein
LPLDFSFYSRYHHPEKKQNMFASGDTFLIVLNSTKQQETGLEDHEKFDLERLSAEEVNEKFKNDKPYQEQFFITFQK